jgi:hypothetical protein
MKKPVMMIKRSRSVLKSALLTEKPVKEFSSGSISHKKKNDSPMEMSM